MPCTETTVFVPAISIHFSRVFNQQCVIYLCKGWDPLRRRVSSPQALPRRLNERATGYHPEDQDSQDGRLGPVAR